jgi:predicted DNA-binding transcriptional regulator AlpA
MSDQVLGTAIEGARMLSIGHSTFWRAVGTGMLPQPVRIGGLTRWRVADLIRAVDPGSPPTTASAPGANRDSAPGCTPREPHQSRGARAGTR